MARSEMPSAVYGPRLGEALSFAADAFAKRIRKGSGVPYITHLLQVMVTVGEHGGDEEQMIAAVLHDYLEDIPGGTHTDLEARFGERVARLVVHLSDSTSHPKPPWEERKRAYLAALREEPEELKLISAADKLHNASSILRDHGRVGDAVFSRFSVSRDRTLWYYREVVEALAHGWSHPLLEELRGVVREVHARVGEPY